MSTNLETCANTCSSWFDSSLSQLNESQRTQFFVLQQSFMANKYRYSEFLKTSHEEYIKHQKETKYLLILGVIFFLLFLFFFGYESNEVRFLVLFVGGFYVYQLQRNESFKKTNSVMISQIEKDFISINIQLKFVYKWLQHEKKIFIEYEQGTDEQKKNYSYKEWIYNYYMKNEILKLVSGFKGEHLPLCIYEHIDV
jgi:hypothetical protein